MKRFRPLLALAAVVAALTLVVADADARSKGSFGSRGARTQSAPAPTATAPNSARPMERTMSQPAASPSAAAASRAATPAAGGFFNRPGLLGGLAAGFLGAGLLGMLFGQGMFGNLGGLASFLGLILQVGLVAMVAWFLWSMWKRRSQQAAYRRRRRTDDARLQHGPLVGSWWFKPWWWRAWWPWSRRRLAAAGRGSGFGAEAVRPTTRSGSDRRSSKPSSGCSARFRPPTAGRTGRRCAHG